MKRYFSIALVLVFLLLSSCASPTESSVRFFAMDTLMSATFYGEMSQEAGELFQKEIARMEGLWSLSRSDSELSCFHQTFDLSSLSEESILLLTLSLEYSEQTSGYFDPTLYPLSRLWGFVDDSYRVPTADEIKTEREKCGVNRFSFDNGKIQLQAPVYLDFGAVAKGYAADLVSEAIRAEGCKSAILSLGGNLITIGNKPDGTPWNVAVQDPFHTDRVIGKLSFSGDKSVVTCGSYQRYFDHDGTRYCHVIDPFTGSPVQNELVSVTVICTESSRADAYSTALFAMGLEKTVSFYQSAEGFDLILVDQSGTIYISEGIQESFRPTDSDAEVKIIQ